jgi:hypothetical protein
LTRFRLIFAASVLAALCTALVACGSSSSSESPQQVIDKTFGSDHGKITSADLNLSIKGSAAGPKGGTLDASLSGPFESQGTGKVPKFAIQVSVDANSQSSGKKTNFQGGLTSTGDAAFVNYKGSDYSVPSAIFDQIKTAYEQSAGKQSQNQQSAGAIFKQLGINNPKDLLTNLKDEGDTSVDGTSTSHISGDLDVNKLIDDLKSASTGASALGALGASVPKLPSPAQLDQIKSAIKTAHFDLYSGKDDHILRRLTVTLSIVPPPAQANGVNKVDVTFDVTLGKVNQSQTITAPSGAKPLSALFSQLGISPGSLGALGALGGVPGSGIAGVGTPTSPPSGTPTAPSTGVPSGATGGASAAKLKKYLQCVQTSSSPTSCQSLLPH